MPRETDFFSFEKVADIDALYMEQTTALEF